MTQTVEVTDPRDPGAGGTSAHAEHLGKHSVTYVVGSVAALLGGVVLLPVYTNALTPAEYGVLETVLRFVSLCIVVAFAGLKQGYLRFYFDQTTEEWHRKLTSTTVASVGIIGFAVMMPLLALLSLFSSHLQVPQFNLTSSLLLSVWLSFEAVYTVGLAFLQVRFLSQQYLIAQCARVILLVSVNTLFLHSFELGLNGALLGNLTVAVVSGLVSVGLLVRWAGLRISAHTIKELVRYGTPYIPTAVFAYIIGNADRLSMLHYGMAATLGLLSLAAKLGEMALSVLTTPLENIWMPYAFAVHNETDGPQKIGMLFSRYIAIMILAALLLCLGAPIAISLLATPAYQDAVELVPIVAIACIFFAAANLTDIGILIAKKTHLKPFIFAATAAVAVALQVLFTPRAGVVGAITATAITAIFGYLIVNRVARRFYRFRADSRGLFIVILAAGTALFVGKAIHGFFPSLAGAFVALFAGTVIYLVSLQASRLLTFADALEFVNQFRKRKTQTI
jgi:O-antigen/teichoic acid export membrane protein